MKKVELWHRKKVAFIKDFQIYSMPCKYLSIINDYLMARVDESVNFGSAFCAYLKLFGREFLKY